MPIRISLAAFFAISLGFSQSPLTDFTFGGPGIDSARGVAVDSSGNIYIVGSTSSFDFPVLNAFQSANSGTQVVYSADAGATWKPLSTPFPNASFVSGIAVDPKNSSTLYIASGNSVCKSTDGGQNFHCVALPFTSSQASINSLVIDSQQPSTIYLAANVFGGVFKSLDGGQTWSNTGKGLPSTTFLGPVSIDPFHPNILYLWVGTGGYVSQDGAASWTPSSLPWPSNVMTAGAFSFDPVTPGVIYGPAFVSNVKFQKSIDGGRTWTQLNSPFNPFSGCCIVPDPKVSGRLYYLIFQNRGSGSMGELWRSQDGGLTWASSNVPVAASGPLVIDPSNPEIFLAGGYRSTDGGQTWAPTNVSRSINPAFAPSASDVVYATAAITSDAFIAKFLPDGQTLVFATYFGGMGNDTGNSIALDPSGNIWIAGTTSSYDLPLTPGALQSALKGSTNAFVAKFTNDGTLLAASYLGGSSQDAALGIALGPNGNPWLIGYWTSRDFPFTTGATALPLSTANGFLAELDSSAATLLYSAPVDGDFDRNGKGIAIDPSGNVLVTGTTYDPQFPLTAGAFQSAAPSLGNPKAFVSKLDSSGSLIYSTVFGGKHSAPAPAMGSTISTVENELDLGVAVATDSAGNAYVTGNTSAVDFPTTSGSYQPNLASNCPYYAFSTDTGFIGTIYTYLIDDSFVVKLSADGKTALYSTLLGGSCYDHPTSIAVDPAGNAYITGETDSVDYPLVSPIEGAPRTRQFASFVSALNPAGAALTFSTYLHAGATPSVTAGLNGSIYVAGSTGLNAQSVPDTGFPNPPPTIATNVYLAEIRVPASVPPVKLVQVANAFSLMSGPVAPGEIVTLNVPGFNPAQSVDIGLNVLAPLTTNLQGVQVLFDGRPAFVMRVSFEQIECIAPAAIAGQRITHVQVTIDGAQSNVLSVSVAPTALGLLAADGSGTGLANAQNSDGTRNSETNPAARGSVVTVFVTGAGITNPAEQDGVVPASSEIAPVATISTFFPGLSTSKVHALPGFVPGIFAYAFSVPTTTEQPPPTKIGITLRTDSSTSQSLFIYVR